MWILQDLGSNQICQMLALWNLKQKIVLVDILVWLSWRKNDTSRKKSGSSGGKRPEDPQNPDRFACYSEGPKYAVMSVFIPPKIGVSVCVRVHPHARYM